MINLTNMTWDDVEDVLFDGTKEQIDAVKCPECGGELKFTYVPATRNMVILCKSCHIITRSHGVKTIPNFARLEMA